MSETMSYQYKSASNVQQQNGQEEVLLSKYSEVEKKEAACFFWGKLTNPYLTARCLLNLSQVVQSSFNLSPFQMSLLKDPIVTAGNEYIRFEGFSHCAGVYARVDVLPDGHDGEFLENGTTNVDFNPTMLAALGGIRKKEKVVLSVGKKEVAISKNGHKVIERKVPLPTKWLKGLTTVQLYLADSEEVFRFNRIQALQLFKSLPKGKVKTDFYLIQRGRKAQFSPIQQRSGVCVGGVHRLRLVEQLIPLANELRVFAHEKGQATTWQLRFGNIHFLLSLSKDTWRGFSGEGAALEALIEDVPQQWINHFDKFTYANQVFNPTLLAIEENLDLKKVETLTAQLSAMGLLGFDLEDNQFFYRRLPFKLHRILSLNPRLKNAKQLLSDGKVKLLSKTGDKIEASVEGSGVRHVVLLQGQQQRCTCTWFSQHQGERGLCKHILAVKKLLLNT